MKNKTIQYIAGICVVLALVAGITLMFVSDDDDLVHINVGHREHVSYMPYYIALENGLFDEYGLTVRDATFETTNQMLSAIVAGHIDVVFSGANLEVAFSLEEKFPESLYVFTTLDVSSETGITCVMVHVDSDIMSLSDVRGKNTATLSGTFSPIWVNFALKSVGLSLEDVTIQGMSPGLQLGALESKQVDVLFTVEPVCTFGVNRGVGKIIYNEPLQHLGTSLTASVMSRDFVTQHPDISEKLITINDKAIDFIRENPDEALSIMAKHTGYREDLIVGMKVPVFSKSSEVHVQNLQTLANTFFEEGILEKKIDVAGMVLG